MTNEELKAGQDNDAQLQEESGGAESGATNAPEPSSPSNGQTPEAPTAPGLDSLKPAMIVKGKVRKIVDFGAFIDVGVGRDGLAHISTLKRAGVDQTLKAGDEVDVVVRLVDFGAFVDIGARTDGLLHISQLGSGFVNHPSEVVNVGDEVQVRILEVDTRRRRISLSMKDVGDERVAGPSNQGREAAQDQEAPGERLPTAMELAFQRARENARRRRRQS